MMMMKSYLVKKEIYPVIDPVLFAFSQCHKRTSFVFWLNQCDMSVPAACKIGLSRMSPKTDK